MKPPQATVLPQRKFVVCPKRKTMKVSWKWSQDTQFGQEITTDRCLYEFAFDTSLETWPLLLPNPEDGACWMLQFCLPIKNWTSVTLDRWTNLLTASQFRALEAIRIKFRELKLLLLKRFWLASWVEWCQIKWLQRTRSAFNRAGNNRYETRSQL